jgi:hypothetical protein
VNKAVKLIILSSIFLSFQCVAENLTAVSLEEVITLSPGGTELRLKGAATKSNARQAVYIGGLYLQDNAESVTDIIENTGAKRFIIKTDDSIMPNAIIRAINLGITVNHSESELTELNPLVELFTQIWKSNIKQGDEICIDFDPAQGTLIGVNGVQQGIIPGSLFYKAFLKTWLGDKPLNKTIKRQLMGG